MRPLKMEHVEHVAHQLARKLMEWDEPIPDFNTRYPNVLESCLIAPFQTFAKKFLYPTLFHKSAILFYLLIKNHPFQNGNKRIAVTSLLTFLNFNKKWIKVEPEVLYKFAVWVAVSDPEYKNGVLLAIREFLGKHIVSAKKIKRYR